MGGIKNFMACHYGPQHHCRHPQFPLRIGASLLPFGQLYEDVSQEHSHRISVSSLGFKGAVAILQPQKGLTKGNILLLFFATLFLADLSNPPQGMRRVSKPHFETKKLNC